MDEMTIGEISRSLARLEKSQHEQTEKLDEIRDQTVKTNGYVGRHEERLNVLDREVRDIKRLPRLHEMKRAEDKGGFITMQIPVGLIDAKKIAAIVASVIAGLIAAWKAGLFS